MSRLEDVVAGFLETRDVDPGVTPAGYLARCDEVPPGAESAIRRALELENALRADDRDDPLVPRRLGDVRLLGTLGEGGMGRVFDVERDGRRLALKVLRREFAGDHRARDRFRREAALAARAPHPSIVRVVESGVDDDPPWILMERADGVSLSEEIAAGPLEPARAAAIVRSLAGAVDAVHSAGLVHRDIKPSNVILDERDSPVLVDFGMAAVDDDSTLTRTGDQLGTPRYMAPEQARGAPTDARTDVHALGLVLFELLTGEPARSQGSREEVMSAAVRAPIRRPSSIRVDLPRDLDRIVLTAAARRPVHRYASAAALADDLSRFLEGDPVTARPPGPLRNGLAAIGEHPARALLAAAAVVGAATLGFGLGRGADAPERRLEASFDAGLAAWADGHVVSARRRLEELRALGPDDPRTRRLASLLDGDAAADRVAGLLIEARRHLDAGDPSEAFAASRSAAELVGGSTYAATLVARSARTPQELAWAEAWTARLVEDSPRSAGAAGARGRVLARLGRAQEAEAELRRGLALDGTSAALHHALAVLLHGVGRMAEAAEEARAAATLTRGESRAVLNNLAAFLDQLGESAEAEAIYRDLCRRFPAHYKAWFNLAFLLDRQGRVAEARAGYEKCLELRPDQIQATMCLAWLLATAPGPVGDVERALDLMRAARARDRGRTPQLERLVNDIEKRTGRRLD